MDLPKNIQLEIDVANVFLTKPNNGLGTKGYNKPSASIIPLRYAQDLKQYNHRRFRPFSEELQSINFPSNFSPLKKTVGIILILQHSKITAVITLKFPIISFFPISLKICGTECMRTLIESDPTVISSFEKY